MTSDIIHNIYAGLSAKKHKSKLELTREEGFLNGAYDIFDLLSEEGKQKANNREINKLLHSAYRAIEKAEKKIIEQSARIKELESLVTKDELTGLTNRRGFFEIFNRELGRVKRGQKKGGLLIMIDIDNFKNINDSYGHQAGDACLIEVARFLKKEIRAMDTAARLGGDEFILLFPKTDSKKAIKRAQELARRLNNVSALWGNDKINIKASVGMRDYGAGDTLQDIIEGADQALYQDKKQRKPTRH